MSLQGADRPLVSLRDLRRPCCAADDPHCVAGTGSADGTAGPGRGDPGLQRRGRSRAVPTPAARTPECGSALLVPHHGRRQREHRRHAADREPAGGRNPGRRGRAPAREGPRTGAARGLVGVGRLRARLHGRGPVHRSRRAAAVDRPAGVRALRPRHRHPPAPRVPGGARPEARVHLAQLQPDAAARPAGPLLRRPVRVQGHPPGGRRAPAAARRGQRLVLRHRVAGARRARWPADPRGARRLGRRPGQPGEHHQHRAGRHPRDHPAAPRARHRAAPPSPSCGPSWVAPRWSPPPRGCRAV